MQCQRTFILDCSAISHVDVAGFAALCEVMLQLQNAACSLTFAQANGEWAPRSGPDPQPT